MAETKTNIEVSGALASSTSTSVKNPDWMKNLPSKLHSVPLNNIAIPGSHDSFAEYLDTSGPVGPDASTAVQDIAKIFGKAAKDIICRWSITQSLTIAQQLNAGVRYFDLRASTKPGTEDIYFLHCLYSRKVEDVLYDIRTFLDEHPEEVVFLDFNHFYGMSEFNHKQFLSMLLEILGYKMCPFLDLDSVTLEMMWENQLQAIIFYHDEIVKDYGQFWPGDKIPAPWADTMDINSLMGFLQKNMEAGRPKDTFYVSQGVLTPNASYIIAHILSNLKESLSEKVVSPFVTWIKEQHIGGLHGVNIFCMDFVEMGNYIPIIISLNKADQE